MASMKCRCGKIVRDAANEGSNANDVQLYIYNDYEWDEIMGMGVTDTFDLPEPAEIWRCPTCERMYFFENNKVVKTYALEV
ncbi:MAG: hypothetical protein FWG68_04845 [Defluviitaleaceae bacterium]|nr:hypothetical protein [Defluviitaleaceae bacterium]